MIRNLRYAFSSLADSSNIRINRLNRSFLLQNNRAGVTLRYFSKRDDSGNYANSSLFKPVPIKPSQDDINVGEFGVFREDVAKGFL